VIQYHYKTWIPIFSALLTIVGWWVWNFFLSAIYSRSPGPYSVRDGFTNGFGKDLFWWGTLGAVLAALVVIELVGDVLQKWFWPSEIDAWQELEQDETIMRRLVERGGEGGYGVEISEA
jgi:phospholipid-translocating ATPase